MAITKPVRHDTLTITATILDYLNSKDLIPADLKIESGGGVTMNFKFEDLTPPERQELKRFVGKFHKNRYSGGIYGTVDYKVDTYDGVGTIIPIFINISDVYECRTVCTPKAHTAVAEEEFACDEE